MDDIRFLNPWDTVARRPRCPECSSHEAATIKVGWLETEYACDNCGSFWVDQQRKGSLDD